MRREGGATVRLYSNDEKSRPRVRNEVSCIDHDRAKPIAAFSERGADRREIFAVMRGQRAADIFENDGARRASFRVQRGHEPPKGPESPGTLALKARAGAGER